MTEPIVVVGAGGFGREVLDVIRSINIASQETRWTIAGVLDDAPNPTNVRLLELQGVKILGGVVEFLNGSPSMSYVIGIGAPAVRREVAEKFEMAGWPPATLVHPAATVGLGVELGAGTIVCAGARVSTNVKVGRHGHIDTNVTIGHDSRLAGFVRLNPGSSVSGDCSIGEGSLIGAGAVVINQVSIGQNVTVGAGACVVRDVGADALVKGVPAR